MEGVLVAAVLVAWAWYSGTKAKEAAVRAARRACERHRQQLLDETVVLQGMRLRRDGSGRVRVLRRYGFEFSADGMERRPGELELLGQRLVAVNLQLDGGVLYEQDPEQPRDPLQ